MTSLTDLPPILTLQQIFDRAALHLLRQNARSFGREFGECAYRGGGGLACAVGCLIPDNAYEPWFDSRDEVMLRLGILDPVAVASTGTSVKTLADLPEFITALRAGGVDVEDPATLGLLRNLQGVHDGYEPEEWLDELHRLARDMGLSELVLEDWVDAGGSGDGVVGD